jgi:RES domain-containing protein
MTGSAPPLTIVRLALERTIRLVSSAQLRPPVLRKLVGEELLADLAEIEGATSGRLTQQTSGGQKLPANELVAGIPHAAFINAAFSYWRPKELNRFNGPDRGAWYAALTIETCLDEVIYHLTRELDRVKDYNTTVDYAEMFASFAGEFADLRQIELTNDCLNHDPAISYPAGNSFAEAVRARGLNGIIYPSARHRGGTCLVALWPVAVQSVTQGGLHRVVWAGSKIPKVSKIS